MNIRAIKELTENNDHGGAYLLAAKYLGLDDLALKFESINARHEELGEMSMNLGYERHLAYDELILKARELLSDFAYKRLYSSL